MKEVRAVIKNLIPKEVPSHDLLINKILQKLPEMGIRYITQLCNAQIWEGASFHLNGRYHIWLWSRNLANLQNMQIHTDQLPTVWSIKTIRETSTPQDHHNNGEPMAPIPDYQFGFRGRHETIQQIHRIVKRISNEMEAGRYCTAVFLNVSQAFDKVWH